MMTLPELIAAIHEQLPGWGWLVRNDKRDNTFFANVTSPDFQSIMVSKGSSMIDASLGQSFSETALSPELALHRAFLKALEHKRPQKALPMFSVPVCKVTAVEDHPEADKLSIVTFDTEYKYALDAHGVRDTPFPRLVSAKLEDGNPRYKVGEWCVFLPENAILPEWLLKKMDFWDEAKGKGTLAGSKGNRVKMRRFAGFESKGALYGDFQDVDYFELDGMLIGENDERIYVAFGADVKDNLGITEYVPQ